jgi:hypothetical protein
MRKQVSLFEYSPSIVLIRNLCQRHEILVLRAMRFHGEPLAISHRADRTGTIGGATEHNKFLSFPEATVW